MQVAQEAAHGLTPQLKQILLLCNLPQPMVQQRFMAYQIVTTDIMPTHTIAILPDTAPLPIPYRFLRVI